MRREVVPLVMSGGAGVRFWPLSTESAPKQFLTAFSNRSLYRQAVERAQAMASFQRTLVMTNEKFKEFIRLQSPEIPSENVILEPFRRDTAPCIALGAMIAERRWPGGIMVVMPSDHLVGDTNCFLKTISTAVERAKKGGLVTIGIPPTFPATVYGYLHFEGGTLTIQEARPLKAFVEKPEKTRAEEFLATGRYLWNSGIFVWQTSAILENFRRHLPETYESMAEAALALNTKEFSPAVHRAFKKATRISIDYGVMEKADDTWVVPASFDWSDIGSWNSAMELVPEDKHGNRVRGNSLLHKTGNSFVVSADEDRPLIVAGLDDCIVISTKDGVLVCRNDMAESLKPLVQRILDKKKEE